MKIISSLVAFAVLIPAMLFACSCCPFTPQDDQISIQRPACHSCCSSLEVSRDGGILVKKDFTISSPEDFLSVFHQTLFNSLLMSDAAHSSLSPSPPGISLNFPTVLRI